MNKLKMGVIGKGFVGSSVVNGFDRDTDIIVVDPKYTDTTIEQCVNQKPLLVFVCVPSPEGETGEIDITIADSVLNELNSLSYDGVVVIKSTIVADKLIGFQNKYNKLRIVYNPEFLTERTAFVDFLNPNMQILGGQWEDCEVVEYAYDKHSSVKVSPTFKTDITTASLVKYTLNCWFSTKVIMMNEFYKLHQASGAETTWEQFTDMISRDVRVGDSHLQVPGPDGHFGFGGHCFPKDTAALLHYAQSIDVDMSVLKQAVETNRRIRDE